jgi:geranylgeranyl diphosphate synthase type I
VALARAKLPANARRFVDELLGDPNLSDVQVTLLQETLRDSGAVDDVENIIGREVDRAAESLHSVNIAASARDQLLLLLNSVTRRTA